MFHKKVPQIDPMNEKQKTSQGENLLMRLNDGTERGIEKFVHVPFGFWKMDRSGLHDFIKMMWPNVVWASNGECGDYTITLYF
jgi:hypothetical protein